MKKPLLNAIALVPVALLILAWPLAGIAAESEAYRWNLKDLYATQSAWDEDAKRMTGQLKPLSACSGQLASPKRFKTCMDLSADVQKRLYRLYSYASQKHDEDTSATEGIDLRQRAEVLGNQVEEATSFFNPEILKIGRVRINAMVKADKSMAQYSQRLDDVLRASAHTLDAKGEALIASYGRITGAAGTIYSTLSEADMPWPKVKLSDGSEVVIDQAAYTKYRALDNRADRKIVFDAFWTQWKAFERSFGVTLYEQLKKDTVAAKVRNHKGAINQS